MARMWEIRSAIEEGIGWLDTALRELTEDPDVCGGWPAWGETADRVGAVLEQARKLLPLHAELEAAIKEEDDRMADYEDPETMGLGRR